MRLIYQYAVEGPGRIEIRSAELPVRITVDPEVSHRSVDIMADRGLAAHAGPGRRGPVIPGVLERDRRGDPIPGTAVRDYTMKIEVGWPGMGKFLLESLGLRSGSSVTGGGSSVRSSGRGSVAAGGNIMNCATGDGARIDLGKGVHVHPEIGVNLLIPIGCDVKIKAADSVAVLFNGTEFTFEAAHRHGILRKV